MRIFNLDTILSFALYPDGNKKRNRNSQGYRLGVDQYSKNGCDETDNGTLKKHLKNLKVLCLGVSAVEYENITPNEIAFVKFQLEKKKQYKVKKGFQSPNENIPLPLFLFYKKKTKSIKALKALTNILNPSFFEIISLHKEKNLELKKLEMSKEDIIKINSDYQIKVTAVTEKIFNEIEVSRPDIVITGIFVDPYFIRKVDDRLFLEDTRPIDTLPKKAISISHEQSFLEESINQKSMESKSDSCNSSLAILSDGTISDVSTSSDQLLSESVEKEPKNLSDTVEDGTIKDVVGGINLDQEEYVHNTDEEEIIASVQSSRPIVCIQDKSYDWNLETKNKLADLLSAYQKQLTKKYFFREHGSKTHYKEFYTKLLLHILEKDTCENFILRLSLPCINNALAEQRDFPIIQKIGQFFKRHNKTEGTLLLENILSTLDNDPFRKTLSV